MSIHSRIILAVIGTGVLALAACSSGTGGAGSLSSSATTVAASTSATPSPTGVSTSPSTATTPPVTTVPPTTAPVAKGCPPGGSGAPAGATSAQTIDVDGDGRPDTLWLMTAAAPARMGITTASGASFETPLTFAGGSQPSALVADVTGNGSQIIAFGFNSRVVDLLQIINCEFLVVTNPQNQPYTFDLGFTGYGTGVGCVDANGDGVRDLVGLNVVRDGAGQATSITRTVIILKAARASNGQTYSLSVTPAALASASTVTCGDAVAVGD